MSIFQAKQTSFYMILFNSFLPFGPFFRRKKMEYKLCEIFWSQFSFESRLSGHSVQYFFQIAELNCYVMLCRKKVVSCILECEWGRCLHHWLFNWLRIIMVNEKGKVRQERTRMSIQWMCYDLNCYVQLRDSSTGRSLSLSLSLSLFLSLSFS